MDNNLCLFCGKGGHVARDCSKATSSALKAKARAAKTDEKSDATLATDSKKIDSSPPSAWVEDCVDPLCATNEVKINMSTLLSKSLLVPLNSDNIANHPFQDLVDSGSTHCFIDTCFSTKHKL